jgi:predicted ribosome quality control (RQC) complex YloA/Tae2 family protein
LQDNREASRKFYQHIDNCVGVEQMAELILIIWKFLRNHIHKKLEQNRISQEREETARQNRSRVAKRSRRGEQVERTEETIGDEDKENQGYSHTLYSIYSFPESYI